MILSGRGLISALPLAQSARRSDEPIELPRHARQTDRVNRENIATVPPVSAGTGVNSVWHLRSWDRQDHRARPRRTSVSSARLLGAQPSWI